MNIGINVSVLKKNDSISGIGYYTYRIVKEMILNDKYNHYYLFSNCDLSVKFPKKDNVHLIILNCNSRLLWSRYLLGFQLKKYKLDIFWSPTHNIPIKRQKYTKYYMTVHDVANYILHNISGNKKRHQEYLKLLLKNSCKIADRIIVPSIATRDDVEKCFGIYKDKISVIYEGGDSENIIPNMKWEDVSYKYKIDKPYFLYVGTLQPRKNIITIVDAYINFRKKTDYRFKLILAGGIGWGMEAVLEKIKENVYKDDIILTGYISEEEKVILYQQATTFLFPSLYEGFGIPILESFSYKVPVITARNSSLPEVGGEAALYIENATSVDELEEKMEYIVELSIIERKQLIVRGEEQFKKFTWENCADMILKEFLSKGDKVNEDFIS